MPRDEAVEQVYRLNQQIGQLYQQGRDQQALGLAVQARDLIRQHVGEDHPDYADSLNNLARVYREMGDYAAAEPLFRQALEIRRAAPWARAIPTTPSAWTTWRRCTSPRAGPPKRWH